MVNFFSGVLYLIVILSTADKGNTEFTIEPIIGPFSLAEGPFWDENDKVLYFVDIPEANIYHFNPATKQCTHCHLNTGTVGVVVPVAEKNNTFLAGAGKDLVEILWDPSHDNLHPQVKILSSVDTDQKDNRFNDGKVDPKGRFWAGTMNNNGNKSGSLYCFNANGTPTKVVSSVTISNGLTWSHNNDTFYYIDSPTMEIVAYDYNKATGDIKNKRLVFNLQNNNIPGLPDGMTIDSSGNLWVAVFNGGRVLKICPKTGKLLQTIIMPATKVTSVAFGGPNYEILYVTTAKQDLSVAELIEQPHAGYIFAIHGLGVSGSPMLACKMS